MKFAPTKAQAPAYTDWQAACRANLAAIDQASGEVKIAAAKEEVQKYRDAEQRADDAIAELRRGIAAASDVDGDAIAKQLLAGGGVKVFSIPDATAQIEALSAGRANVTREKRRAETRLAETQAQYGGKVSAAVDPMAEEFHRRAQAIFTDMLQLWADAKAIEYSVRHLKATGLTGRLGEAIRAIRRDSHAAFPTPQEIVASPDVLAVLGEAGAIVGIVPVERFSTQHI